MAKTGHSGIRGVIDYTLTGSTYSAGTLIEGSRALSREVSQEITNQFADNKIYDSTTGVKTVTGELTSYHLNDEFYTNYLGFIKNMNNVFSDSNPLRKKAGLAFIQDFKNIDTQTNQFKICVMYDTSFSEPAIDIVTLEDSSEYTELVAPYSSVTSEFVVDDNGNLVSYAWFTSPPGYSFDEVVAFLMEGIPTPTGDAMPPKDTVAPVITVGTPLVTTLSTADNGVALFGDLITEASISAMDNLDGNVIGSLSYTVNSIVYDALDPIDLSVIGDIVVSLNVSDSSLNAAITEIVTIQVTV